MSYTQKIDSYFAQRKPSEKALIYLTIASVIFLIFYQYLFPLSEKFLRTEKVKKENIERQLNIDISYLSAMKVNGDQQYYVKLYTDLIQKEKEKFLQIAAKKEYLDNKIKTLSYLLYNKRKWAEFLNSITHKAAKNGVDIDYIENSFLGIDRYFGHVLEISIGCEGDFRGLIGFINDIEQSDLVVDIYNLEMVGDNPIKSLFKVSVWGIKF